MRQRRRFIPGDVALEPRFLTALFASAQYTVEGGQIVRDTPGMYRQPYGINPLLAPRPTVGGTPIQDQLVPSNTSPLSAHAIVA